MWVSGDHFYLYRETRTGYVLAQSLVPFVSTIGDKQLVELWAEVWRFIMKRPDASTLAAAVDHASSAEVQKRWPSLHEWLTAGRFEEDGSTRAPPTVTIWASGGQWKACLRDKELGLVLWLGAETLTKLVALADGIVLSPDAPWRHDDQAHERNGKRVKKGS